MFISKNELLWFPRPENQKEASSGWRKKARHNSTGVKALQMKKAPMAPFVRVGETKSIEAW
ncbi:MAG: hypothetical protein KKF79_02030 [Gammaproteobacteria bacterium]|nr:hypothetical protein [Gammaproteobacteria bacterium]